MICKFCNGEMPEDTLICPVCGRDNAQEPLQEAAPEEAAAAETCSPETAESVAPEMIAAVLDEAAQEAEEETADTGEEEPAEEELIAPKKKTWVKVTAIICCVALLLGLGSAVWYGINGGFAPRKNDIYAKDSYTVEDAKLEKSMDKVVATIGEHKLTNGQLQIYYWMQFYNFVESYGSYLSYLGLDVSKPLSEQSVAEGEASWEQNFLEMGLAAWHRSQALVLEAEAKGFQMPEDLLTHLGNLPAAMEESAVAYGFANADEMVAKDMGKGCGLDEYMSYMTLYTKGVEYLNYIYEQANPSEEEVREYFLANAEDMQSNYGVSLDSGKLVDVRHILIKPEGGTTGEDGKTTYSEEAWAACEAEAQQILDQWKAGEASEESFAQLAASNSQDPGSYSNGGLYTNVYEGQMVEPFEEWCFDESRKYGDTGLVKTDFGYHIMYFVAGEEGWLRYGTEALIGEICNEVIEKAMETYPMEVKYKEIVLGQADLNTGAN